MVSHSLQSWDIKSPKFAYKVIAYYIGMCICLEFLIACAIIRRERKLTVPELYYIAQNSAQL